MSGSVDDGTVLRVKWSHGKKHNLFSYQEPDTWNWLQYTVKIKVLEFVSENHFITLKYQKPNFRPQLTFEHKLFGKYSSNSYFFVLLAHKILQSGITQYKNN